MEEIIELFVIYFAVISLLAAGLTLYDKYAARRGKWRIRERTLLWVSVLGGSVAMLVTMLTIRHKTKHLKFMLGIPALILLQAVAAASVMALYFYGILHFNNPSSQDYPVRGVDVSTYQGEIDWQVLSQQNIQFVYIKATEGSSLKDTHFEYNFTQASQTGLLVGAYHFFSFESPAETQFDNIVRTVPIKEDMLPIAIDVEFYGGNHRNPPPKDTVTAELNTLLEKLADYYGKVPVIYATEDSYNRYVADGFSDYGIWYRDVFHYPKLIDGRSFTFWQFSNRHRLAGYQGREDYIDVNVFDGTFEELSSFGQIHPEP